MKRTPLKLVVRREMLRMLVELDLARVAGGNPDVQKLDTASPETGCPLGQPAVPQVK
jgi:hypothetical protein